MTRAMMRTSALLLLLIFSYGCSSSGNRISFPPPLPVLKTEKLTRQAILSGMEKRRWMIQSEKKGAILARIDVRSHTALVWIYYNQESITFEYGGSYNLDCKPVGNSCSYIHKSYNTWVLKLIKGISTSLTELKQPKVAKLMETKLNPYAGILISVPENGWYGEKTYTNSGKETAKAVKNAFLKHSKIVVISDSCKKEDCLKSIDVEKYAYYVKPEILHWEDRATEWSGRADKVKIQVVVYDSSSKKQIAEFSYSAKSKWLTFGGDQPQDLLQKSLDHYVNLLFF